MYVSWKMFPLHLKSYAYLYTKQFFGQKERKRRVVDMISPQKWQLFICMCLGAEIILLTFHIVHFPYEFKFTSMLYLINFSVLFQQRQYLTWKTLKNPKNNLIRGKIVYVDSRHMISIYISASINYNDLILIIQVYNSILVPKIGPNILHIDMICYNKYL